MDEMEPDLPEALRLEQVWSGEFGSDYTERNRGAAEGRRRFWTNLLGEISPRKVLEIGCNAGPNLVNIGSTVEQSSLWGVDINREALARARERLPEANLLFSHARWLPFRDRMFDLAFTMGVLIHQPEATLPLVMGEVVRTSSRYVLCGEYHAEETVEVPYRGLSGALFKRNYGGIYRELFPALREVSSGHLTAEDGFDDVTYHLFERAD